MDWDLQFLLAMKSEHDLNGHHDQPPRKKRRHSKLSHQSYSGVDTSCLEALYNGWRIIPEQSVPSALKWATTLYELGEEERANEAILVVGGSKGRLRQEWERLRAESKEVAGSGMDTEKAPTEPDVALEDIELN
jgi:hypothetical protein